MSNVEVLIVDDERHMTEYLKYLVPWSEYGFTKVKTENKGLKVKEQLLVDPPNLMLVDIRMPEITGLELAELVNINKIATKIIIVSGFSEFDYAHKALRSGVIEYLVKPILKKDLINVLAEVFPELVEMKNQLTIKEKPIEEDGVVRYLKQFMKEHLDEPLTLELIGEQVDLTPKYLSHFFKKKTGVNVLTYLTEVRMNHAEKLLLSSDLHVKDIGEMVGYKKTQYFITLFKNYYYLTPQQYRVKMLIERCK